MLAAAKGTILTFSTDSSDSENFEQEMTALFNSKFQDDNNISSLYEIRKLAFIKVIQTLFYLSWVLKFLISDTRSTVSL